MQDGKSQGKIVSIFFWSEPTEKYVNVSTHTHTVRQKLSSCKSMPEKCKYYSV